MRGLLGIGALIAVTIPLATPAAAQLSGSHLLGDYGVKSGTQPAPGFYSSFLYYRYSTDTITNADGDRLGPSPDSPASVTLNAYAPIFMYISKFKLFGANYGAFVAAPWINGSIEASAFDLEETSSTRYTDTQIRLLDLGWHTAKADINAGMQIYAPTGEYEPGASGNTGKGMWTYEPFVGATVYLDEKKTLSLATTAYWEIHSEKEDTDVRVGQILNLEGGVGKSFMGGGLVLGAAYYAHWKLTEDRLANFVLPGGGSVDATLANKDRVYGFGPDVTLPVATKSKLIALVNLRYFWETGARSKTEGSTFLVTATFPIPSVKLN